MGHVFAVPEPLANFQGETKPMRKLITIGAVLGALAFGMYFGATASGAQGRETPGQQPRDTVYCKTSQYDLNGDGVLAKSDMLWWRDQVVARGCVLGEVATGNCVQLDINHDTYIDQSDMMVMYDHFLTCYEPAQNTDPGRR